MPSSRAIAGSQNNVHAVVPLGAAVADIRRVIRGGVSAFFKDAVFRLLSQPVEVHASRMADPIYVLDQNLRLYNILLVQPEPNSSASNCTQSCRSDALFCLLAS